MSETVKLDNKIKLEVGSKVYNWRYGSMTVKSIDGEYILLDVDDNEGINNEGVLLEPWKNKLNESTKKYAKNSIDKWLFKVPERVGSTKPTYGDKSSMGEAHFQRKLHKSFDKDLVMECKSNFSAYMAKIKVADSLEEEESEETLLNKSINVKEIEELTSDMEKVDAKRLEKVEELAYISKKLGNSEIKIKTLEGNISKYKKKISDKERRIIAREAELDKLELEQNSNTYSKNFDIESEIRRLEDGIDDLKNEINEDGNNMEKIVKEQVKLENKKNQLDKEVNLLKTEAEEIEREIQFLS